MTSNTHWGGLGWSVKRLSGGIPLVGWQWVTAPSDEVYVFFPGVLFTSRGKMERVMDRWFGAPSAAVQVSYRSVLVKRELNQKAKLSISQSIYVPTMVMSIGWWPKELRSLIQAAKMTLFPRVAGLSFRGHVQLLRGSGVNPEHAGEMIYLIWPRGSPGRAGNSFWGEGRLE